LLGICLNFSEFEGIDREGYMAALKRRYQVPVAAPLSGGLDSIIDGIEGLIAKRRVDAASPP
jgi:hypothetical protein